MTYNKKQTQQLRLRGVAYFNKYIGGNLLHLGKKEIDKETVDTEGGILRLVNHKNGHKISCIHHETDGEPYLNPVRALERQCVHLRKNRSKLDCLISDCFEKGRRQDIKNDDM